VANSWPFMEFAVAGDATTVRRGSAIFAATAAGTL
jgi:hypothetical protein